MTFQQNLEVAYTLNYCYFVIFDCVGKGKENGMIDLLCSFLPKRLLQFSFDNLVIHFSRLQVIFCFVLHVYSVTLFKKYKDFLKY